MKKLIAAAGALALTAGLAFAETHETLKAHTLQTSVGDISFGAWGRSTFNVGRQNTSKKITVDTTATGDAAVAVGSPAITNYTVAQGEGGDLAAMQTAAGTLGVTLDNVTLEKDGSNLEAYATAVGTYAAAKLGFAALNGDTTAQSTMATLMQRYGTTDTTEVLKAYGTEMGEAAAGSVIVDMLKPYGAIDESESRNYASLAPDWSYGCRIGFWIVGRTPDQHFGFDFNLDADARALFVHKLWDANESADDTNYNEDGKYAVAIGDQAKIWGLLDNPLFQTKIAFGRMREQELRGTIGDFGQRESSEVKSEDDIFQEIWTATGLFASIKGNEDSVLNGFYLNGAVDVAGTLSEILGKDPLTQDDMRSDSATDKASDKSVALYKAVRDSQIGIGYTLPGLFQIKGQYWGDSIDKSNFRYELSKYAEARKAGYGINDYYGRLEFGIDWLGFMGGATSFLDPKLNLEETPNANLIELGFKLPLVTREGLRDYDPEKFYNWYSCLGTMGVIQKGFILYKGHLWGGQGTSNLKQYSYKIVEMDKDNGANIFMAGVDFLAEVCINPFGKQDVFVGLSGNYNITSASADGKTKTGLTLKDLELRQHKIGAEIYVKKTFAANNFIFAGIAGDFQIQTMEGNVNGLVDLKYDGKASKFYMPIGVELFF